MIRSMTAFARGERTSAGGTLICEIRSVNHRYLDLSFRLPEALRELELSLREQIRATVGRGKVDCSLRWTEEEGAEQEQTIDRDAALRLRRLLEELGNLFDRELVPAPADLLRWPGIITSEEVDRDRLLEESRSLVQETLNQLVETRAREGAELKQLLLQRLDEIDSAVAIVREQMPGIIDNYRTQLRSRLEQLAQEVDEGRFEQEMIYLLQKSDVAEELDRLVTHVEEVRRVLEEGGVVGRRLDFLMQELNREANTLSSKALSSSTSLQAVDLKVLIEQMREQIQNIE